MKENVVLHGYKVEQKENKRREKNRIEKEENFIVIM